MTPKAQRIAIAEFTGKELPYNSCLNAMHEAEKLAPDKYWTMLNLVTLSDEEVGEAVAVLASDCPDADILKERKRIGGASAAKRSEAFVRTINKWID